MKIYEVDEYIVLRTEKNAHGLYSSLEKAKAAILARVAQEYTEEEMKSFYFDEDNVYMTVGNDWTNGCAYYIYERELDSPIN